MVERPAREHPAGAGVRLGGQLFYESAFEVSLITGYWLTNVIGLLLLHKGVKQLATAVNKPATRRELPKDLAISLLYTALIVVLVKLKIFAPVEDYFSKK
jgi:hypothetical protein